MASIQTQENIMTDVNETDHLDDALEEMERTEALDAPYSD